jgi:putative ABC transport system substrate-binding protein
MRRRSLLGLLLALPCFAWSQSRPTRIGILSARSRVTPANPDPYFEAFLLGMRDLGYIDGENLAIEWRYAEGAYQRLPELAADLLKSNLALIVSHTTPGTHALLTLNRSIPIVITSASDPVASGLVQSLAHPGGNVTGMSISTEDLSPKQLELVRAVLPGASRVGVFFNPQIASHAVVLRNIELAARKRGLRVVPMQARTIEEISRGFDKLVVERVQAVLFLSDSFYTWRRKQIAATALKHRMPSIYISNEGVKAGILMSYGSDVADSYRRAATYVDRILKGARPGDLPIEQPTKFHLALNRGTAKALGIRFPRELELRADELID